MASFNVDVKKTTGTAQAFNALSYTVTGLAPNSSYDVYVNGTKYNIAVTQGDETQAITNEAAKVRGTINAQAFSYLTTWFLQLSTIGVANNGIYKSLVDKFSSKALQDTPIQSDAAGVAVFTLYPSLAKAITVGGILGGAASYWNLKSIELRGEANIKVDPPAPIDEEPDEVIYGANNVIKDETTYKKVNTTVYKNKFPNDILASEVSLYFDYIQTFYLDSKQVENASTVTLDSIALYFIRKPNPTFNASNIIYPGVHLYICECDSKGDPDLRKVYAKSKIKKDWWNIIHGAFAEDPTTFRFINGLTLKTNKSYGIVINFEDPNYKLASATRKGRLLQDVAVGFTASDSQASTQTSNIYNSNFKNGELFRASNYGEVDNNPKTQDRLFHPITKSDLKFSVIVRKYNMEPRTKTIELINDDYEFVQVDSLPLGFLDESFFKDDLVYIDYGDPSANVFYADSSVLFEASPIEIWFTPKVSQTFSSTAELNGEIVEVIEDINPNSQVNGVQNLQWVTGVKTKTLDGSRVATAAGSFENSGKLRSFMQNYISQYCLFQNINKVNLEFTQPNQEEILNGRHISFVNGASYLAVTGIRPPFLPVVEGGTSPDINITVPFSDSFVYSTNSSGLKYESDNILVRPVTLYAIDEIDYVTNTVSMICATPRSRSQFWTGISANGVNQITWTADTGWANGDVITVDSVLTNPPINGAGPVNAVIRVLEATPTGQIASLVIENPGWHIPENPTVTIPGGRAANFTITPGAQLVSKNTGLRATISGQDKLTIHNVDEIIPTVDVQVKNGNVSEFRVQYSEETNPDYNYVGIKNRHTLHPTPDLIDNGKILPIKSYNAQLLGRTKELEASDGLYVTGTGSSEGKSSLITFDITIDNQWESPEMIESLASIQTFDNIINNDSTDEHLPESGNADARYVSKKIQFAKNRYAEDVRVFSTLWRPKGTNVKYYVKAHNSQDEESFEDKYWTELEIKDLTFEKEFSSLQDENDLVEYTLGLKPYPTLNKTASGGTVTVSGTTVTSSGPLDLTTVGLSSGDVVVLYDKEFPETTYIVSRLTSTPTAGSFTISDNVTNTSITNAFLSVANTSAPYEIFNDVQNDGYARYFTDSGDDFITYDSMAVKAVLLSDKSYVVPHVEDIRAIGVSV